MEDRLSDFWKVPFRQVYCATFFGWVRETVWCLVLLPIGMKLGLVPTLPALIPGDEGDGSGTGG